MTGSQSVSSDFSVNVPCPFCGGTDRCWIRGTAGNLRASCAKCPASSADILAAVGNIALPEHRIPRRREPLAPTIIEYCRSLPEVAGAGLEYLGSRERGCLRPTADCRWLPVEWWSTSPVAWVLARTKRTGNVETAGRIGYPAKALMAGCIVYLWRGLDLRVCGVQIEGVLHSGQPVPYVTHDGKRLKRYYLPGSTAKGAAFVARALGWPDDPLHVCEGEPDALYLAQNVEGGVIGAHGAGLLASLAPWCTGRHVTIWPDGDKPGEDGARKLRDILLDRGQTVKVRFGRDDVCARAAVCHG